MNLTTSLGTKLALLDHVDERLLNQPGAEKFVTARTRLVELLSAPTVPSRHLHNATRTLREAARQLPVAGPAADVAIDCDLAEMLVTAVSGFDGQSDLKQHLAEGSLVGVNAIASQALFIPPGEYLVWITNLNSTKLLPLTSRRNSRDVFERRDQPVEVMTPMLLQHWDKLSRCLTEAESTVTPPRKVGQRSSEGGRPELATAISNSDKSLSDIADDIGVDVSTISRYLGWRNRGGKRNPSFETMKKLKDELGIDPNDLFGDGARPSISPQVDQPTTDDDDGDGEVKQVQMQR